MDHRARRVRRTFLRARFASEHAQVLFFKCVAFLALPLIVSACRSKPITEVFDPVAVAQAGKCHELGLKRENCSFVGEVLMTIQVAEKPDKARKRDPRNPNLIAGQCEVHILNLEDPAVKPDVRPCPAVTLAVSNASLIGDSPRSNRLDVKGGIVGGLPQGLYSVVATSELYKTRSVITDVPSGSLVKIVIQMPVKLELPPDPNLKK
jgi:hypothetical protein